MHKTKHCSWWIFIVIAIFFVIVIIACCCKFVAFKKRNRSTNNRVYYNEAPGQNGMNKPTFSTFLLQTVSIHFSAACHQQVQNQINRQGNNPANRRSRRNPTPSAPSAPMDSSVYTIPDSSGDRPPHVAYSPPAYEEVMGSGNMFFSEMQKNPSTSTPDPDAEAAAIICRGCGHQDCTCPPAPSAY